jgi:hypothetical protein
MQTTLATALAMLLFLFLTTAASAQTINGCVKDKNGALRIVSDPTSCTSRETPISWNQQGPQGVPGAAGDPGPAGVPGSDAEVLHVFDATGRDLGLFGGFYFSPLQVDIYFKAFGTVAAVGVTPGLPTLKILGTLYWESSDCTGQAYSIVPSRLFIASVSGPYVYAATRSEVATILPRSTSSHLLFPLPEECFTTTSPDLLSAAPLDLLDPETDLGVSFPLPGPLYVGLPAE